MEELDKLMDELLHDKYCSTVVDEILESDTYKQEFEEIIKHIEEDIKVKGDSLDDDFEM